MYMTRFPVNRTRRESMRLLTSPHRLHAAVVGSIPPQGITEVSSRPLWRLDTDSSGTTWLYIVSSIQPSLVGLDEQIGWPDRQPQWESVEYDPFLSRISSGQTWAFRLVANPVRTVRKPLSPHDDSNIVGKRVGHLAVDQQANWLIKRAERHGFSIVHDHNEPPVPRLVVSDRTKRTFTHGSQSKPITLATARFDGTLYVNDPDQLRTALVSGIGHGKAFGCGLLTLAPIADSRE